MENKFRVVFEDAPDAYYISDLNGNFIDGNKTAENIVEYKREELIGKSFLKLKLLPSNQIAKAAKLLALNKLGRPTGPDEFTLKTKSGKEFFVEIRTYPANINGNKVVLGIARDISRYKELESKLRQANEKLDDKVKVRTRELSKVNKKLEDRLNSCVKFEEALEDSKNKYEKLFNESPDMIVTMNRLGIITECNRNTFKLIGVNKRDLVGKHFSKLNVLFAKDIPRYFKIYYMALKGKKIQPVEVNIKTSSGCILYHKKILIILMGWDLKLFMLLKEKL